MGLVLRGGSNLKELILMSFCLPCTPTKELANCVTSIIIGTISQANTAVFVYFENMATGVITRFDVTSAAGTGVVTITKGSVIFVTGQDYEVWITLATATSIDQRLSYNVNGQANPVFCTMASFKYVSTSTGTVPTYTTETLSV